ncbi:hypothetical protein C1I95_14890 [Micromonospora craterilacus]|uniref:Uncharacterized protein n=1 Tax=Micromonospora craterilacus TaxID=1655439 RepID=A0A2W2E184_9ACTN|nr:tetratricopeptide repeat protein [Micromonospora craterilacus]PZG17742.1 hypothetical protein C1I95_14890 [Micromonospora craterilacus]
MEHIADSDIDLTTATDAAQFVALLRRLRDQSGLPYRLIARRAETNGDVLPASTLATMLGRSTLPRRDLVLALLRACNVPFARQARWLDTWRHLAANRQLPRVDPQAPDGDPPWQPTAVHTPRSRPGDPAGTTQTIGVLSTGGAGPTDPRTIPARPVPFQLPPPSPVLVGRDHELELVLAGLAPDHAVLTLVGPGGIGKSALALHAAHRAAARFPDGCLYVDLHGASAGIAPAEPADVLAGFLHALGVRSAPSSIEEASALFRTATAGRSLLVVLDNAASAAQVRLLLPSGARCATVVTSRWKLADLDTNARIALRPLPGPAARALLVHLCGADRVAATPAAVEAIIELCGGLPLALRIVGARAASRPDSRGLATLASRITDHRRHLDELQVGDLSVRTSIRLGYRTFAEAPDEERQQAARLFRLASLPDWTETTAAGCAVLLAAPVDRIEWALEQLLDAHLVEPAGDERYRFHDSVRIFAREQAAAADPADDRAAALRRLATAFLAAAATAAELLFPHDTLPYDALRHPDGDLLLGPASVEQAWQWLECERTNLLMIAGQQLDAGDNLHQVHSLGLVVAKYLDYAGHYGDQERFGQFAVAAAEQLGDRPGTAKALNMLAIAMLRHNRLANGITLLERALATQRELGDQAGTATCLNNLGNAYRDSGDLDTALRYLRETLTIRQSLGDRYRVGSTLDNIGIVLRRLGDIAGALRHHEAGLAITRELGDQHRESLMLTNLAETEHLAGFHVEALNHARAALRMCHELGNVRGCGLALRLTEKAYAGLSDRGRPPAAALLPPDTGTATQASPTPTPASTRPG